VRGVVVGAVVYVFVHPHESLQVAEGQAGSTVGTGVESEKGHAVPQERLQTDHTLLDHLDR
jgi:hypothetical protein